ncbi:MAG TPA: ROK family protein [Solirubrobacteraceae bacterium]|jgi:glucokinase|nr:ROK family protein [Solirubrobacteraceae bacterium]
MPAYGGIDLGGTKIQTIVMRDGDHSVLGQARSLTPHEGGPAAVVDALVACMSDAAGSAGIEIDQLAGIGVGVPGEVDAQAGTLARATNLSEWLKPFPLAAALSERLGTGVKLGNDVSVAAQAELLLGAGRGAGSLLCVFWGTGVGGAVAFDGKLWHGRGDAGEIGHMVVKQGGARCTCGRRGCMEAYSGRRAMELKARRLVEKGHHTDLFKIMHERKRETLSSGVWAHALEHEDKLAKRLIDRAVEALGNGVASAVNLLDVELVLLGGGLGTRFGEPMLERLAEAMKPHLYGDEHPPTMRLVELGDLGGALGAALLCTEGAAR